MANRFRLPPPRLLTEDQLVRIHETAVRILVTHGLRVRSSDACAAAARAGLRTGGDRVFPDRARIEGLVARTRASSGGGERGEVEAEPRLILTVPNYAEFVHDLDSDDLVPYTTERLIEATKFVDTMTEHGVIGSAPGVACDVPGELQQLHKYRIAIRYSRNGWRPVDERSPRAMPYALGMAEALGHPYRYHAVYVVSPLSLGGDSLECLRVCQRRLEGIHVSNMSSVGATAPIALAGALALGAAEVIGAALVMELFSGLPVSWSIRVCPFDPRTMAMSLGAPEELLFQRASDELTAWYHGRPPGPPSGMLHTQAKLPDQQAAAERMCQLTFGALFGARSFSGGGTLSLDEVFSAEQLVYDCELRDHVQRFLRGADLRYDLEQCVAEAAEGLEQGFLGLDSTASLYRQVYWLPRLFERRRFTGWQEAGKPRLRGRAKAMVREQLRRHDYQPDPAVMREVERIYARAERELAG